MASRHAHTEVLPEQGIRFSVFDVERDNVGLLVATWKDLSGPRIRTHRKDTKDLQRKLKLAVTGQFAGREMPRRIVLHFVKEGSYVHVD